MNNAPTKKLRTSHGANILLFVDLFVCAFAGDMETIIAWVCCNRDNVRTMRKRTKAWKRTYERFRFYQCDGNEWYTHPIPTYHRCLSRCDIPPRILTKIGTCVINMCGGLTSLVGFPRGTITATMRARDRRGLLSQTNSILLSEIHAPVTLLLDKDGWALVFRYVCETNGHSTTGLLWLYSCYLEDPYWLSRGSHFRFYKPEPWFPYNIDCLKPASCQFVLDLVTLKKVSVTHRMHQHTEPGTIVLR
jgi:hypothetical protein